MPYDFTFMLPVVIRECNKIALNNFGLAKNKWFNDSYFVTILDQAFSNLWANPIFDDAHSEFESFLYKVDKIESDDEFYIILYNWVFAVCMLYVINKGMCGFILGWSPK